MWLEVLRDVLSYYEELALEPVKILASYRMKRTWVEEFNQFPWAHLYVIEPNSKCIIYGVEVVVDPDIEHFKILTKENL